MKYKNITKRIITVETNKIAVDAVFEAGKETQEIKNLIRNKYVAQVK